ncbi:hypothetical protein EDD18DRAFT_1334514 [Armillaria luteobubalina]|uniref:Uncharacterized protein n=1 Tax=Armillaria luteobubalina TaxID=153913 RepID=A0AA39PWN4_9AGAR|nr:hypothetical protein EDD18DRAFT_1334514 [Armillaria luteobubalina]
MLVHQVILQRNDGERERGVQGDGDMDGGKWFIRYEHDVFGEGQGHVHDKKMCQKYAYFPKVTLSSFTEASMPEPSISVLKQWAHTGRCPIIPSSLADTPCACLGVKGVLGKLNTILNTSYTLEIRSLSSLLNTYILKDYDFGTAFSHLHPFWYHGLTDIEDKLCSCKASDW